MTTKVKSIHEITKVVLALDLSNMDKLLIQYSQFLKAHLPNLEEVILYHNIRFDYPDEAEALLSTLSEPLAKTVEDKVRAKAKKILQHESFQVVIEENDNSALGIVALQKRMGAELVIFGKKVTYEGSGYLIERVLYQKIASHVMVVPETAFHRVEQVLVPIEFTENSARAVIQAEHLAKSLDATYTCQHVYAIPNIYFPFVPVKDIEPEVKDNIQQRWKNFKNKYLKTIGEPKIELSYKSDQSIPQTILNYSFTNNMDLIVLPFDDRHSSNTVVQVLKLDMHIPILMVR